MKNYEFGSNQYFMQTDLFHEFDENRKYIDSLDPEYYTYLINQDDIQTKRLFYKAFNISSGSEIEYSVKTTFEVLLCSNETIRVNFNIKDLNQKTPIKSSEHQVNFSKHILINGAKFNTELIRYKEFFFVVQIQLATLENNENTAFEVKLFSKLNSQ